MNLSYIKIVALAHGCRDLTEVYALLYRGLCQALLDDTPVCITDIMQAINLLMPKANPELKEQARIDFVNFIKSFSDQTQLNVVELK